MICAQFSMQCSYLILLLSFYHFENHFAWLSHFLSCLSAFLTLWVCSLGKPWGWGLCCFAICLPSQEHLPFLSFDSHLCVGNVISPPSSVLTFTSTYLMTSNLKSVPSYPLFCLISTYFAYCFETVFFFKKSLSFQKTNMDWNEYYIKVTEHAIALKILH